MYVDYYLRFSTKTAADKVLFILETVTEGNVKKTVLRPKYAAVDVIGTIYSPTGVILETPEGDTPEMKAVAGYHANVRHTQPVRELDAFVVAVNSPARAWAN